MLYDTYYNIAVATVHKNKEAIMKDNVELSLTLG